MHEPVPKPTHKIENTTDSVEVWIPAARRWFLLIFLPFWLLLWGQGWSKVVTQIRGGLETGQPDWSLLFWLVFWAVAGVVMLSGLLWQLFGVERLIVTKDTLSIKRSILGVGITRNYAMTNSRHLKVLEPEKPKWWSRSRSPNSLYGGPGTIGFEYGAKTVRFGLGLDPAEASQIVKTLRTRFSSLSAR